MLRAPVTLVALPYPPDWQVSRLSDCTLLGLLQCLTVQPLSMSIRPEGTAVIALMYAHTRAAAQRCFDHRPANSTKQLVRCNPNYFMQQTVAQWTAEG